MAGHKGRPAMPNWGSATRRSETGRAPRGNGHSAARQPMRQFIPLRDAHAGHDKNERRGEQEDAAGTAPDRVIGEPVAPQEDDADESGNKKHPCDDAE